MCHVKPVRLSTSSAVCLAGLIAALAAVAVWTYDEHQEDRYRLHRVRRGVLYRSRQPGPDELNKGLKRRGITTIVNLRPEAEDPAAFQAEERVCQALGVGFVNIPVQGRPPTDDQLEAFLKLVRRNRGAVLVHCEMGRSRTGVMVAAFRVVVEGLAPRQALDEIIDYGANLEEAERADMLAFLERLSHERRGWLARTAGRP
jgi:tyrosine-protein phosphatase SIW14